MLVALFRIYNPRPYFFVILNLLIVGAFLTYAYGWYKLLSLTVGAKIPWGLKEYSFVPGVHLIFENTSFTKITDVLPPFKLILTRDPWKFRGENNVYWITKMTTNRSIQPTDLEKLGYIASTFMNASSDKKVIIIDGIEYLVIENGFERVFKWLTVIHDIARTTNTLVLVPIKKEALKEREIALLKREFREY
ncbi:hypothetical protein A3L04_08870 [Thermococcus chitonophagus]|uniref:DUF835 domain-containing protein n=1 Tax=Thermococcus chitonophagus TaxID=54262 RepID=A0A2Z2NCG0_9EURY|nr:DUF835 domain-containing protein [Thermococcus chitonophagus]ASJ17172.1 hypothetical protein A3L04_08870 [Thermococcus chitonophagus]